MKKFGVIKSCILKSSMLKLTYSNGIVLEYFAPKGKSKKKLTEFVQQTCKHLAIN